MNLRSKINFLQELARADQVNILLGDESMNPFIFIHIDLKGESSTVGVVADDYNDRDELTIEGVYNHAFGSFALETPLQHEERHVLDESFRDRLSSYELMQITEGPVTPTVFGMYKDQFEVLRNFVHHYFVMPAGKTLWQSNDEKAELFIVLMNAFHNHTKRKLCFFPPILWK